MKTLFHYEIRKILCKPLSPVSLVLVLLFSILLSNSTYQSMYAFDGKYNEGSGKKAVALEKDLAEKYGGTLTDEKVQQMLADFRPTYNLQGMNAKYIYQNSMQSAVFSHFANMDGSWNGLRVSDVYGQEEIKVGYVYGWLSTSQNLARVLVFLSIVIILLVAPVFSGEYGGVDAILLTSKYGKTKGAMAKVLASFTLALLVTALLLGVHLALAYVFYGPEGLDCSILFAPVDFEEGYIPFNISCKTVLKYQIVLAFLSAISVTGLTLLFSALCKNQLTAFIASASLHILPLMLSIPESSGIYRLVVLMPLYYTQYISLMSVEQMDNGLLYAVWSVPAALFFAIGGAAIAPRIFGKHQVG